MIERELYGGAAVFVAMAAGIPHRVVDTPGGVRIELLQPCRVTIRADGSTRVYQLPESPASLPPARREKL